MTTTGPEIVETPKLAVQWTRICDKLQVEVGEVEYHTWLRQMSLGNLDGDEITVTLPTRFLRDWVSTRYGDRLSALWQAENAGVRRVDFRVGQTPPSVPLAASPPAPHAAVVPAEPMRRQDVVGPSLGFMPNPGCYNANAHRRRTDGRTAGAAIRPRRAA